MSCLRRWKDAHEGFPEKLVRVLREKFGHESFRPGQEQVLRALLEGQDVLAGLSTGGGQSAGYKTLATEVVQEQGLLTVLP